MLEGLVAGLLNRFLGMYVKNLNAEQLKVGTWSGEVNLKNLELRREALDQLKLPLNVIEGHLGALKLTVPWSNLKGAPVRVLIEDVYLLAAPKEDAEYDEEEEERRRQAIKIEKLDSAEILKERNEEGLSQEEQKKSQSFTESLVSTIVNNVQITVRNIHIRYEDSISAPGHPFAAGITLEEFSAVSTDGEWKPTYIQNSVGVAHKLATLEALAIYFNTDSTLMGTGREAATPRDEEVLGHDEMMEKFKELIVKGENPDSASHQFILKPVSGRARIEMDRSGKIDKPKVKAGLLFDEIGLVLDDDQYRDVLMMVDTFHYFMRHQEYKKLQPKGETPLENPRAWLEFAGDAVLSKIHERNRRWSWAYFAERRDDRVRYIELFKMKKRGQLLSPEAEEFAKLEWKLSYEDLRFWRYLARNQLKKENIGVKKPAPVKKQGWIAWARGVEPEEDKGDETTAITDEQREELYKAIDWDEKNAITAAVELPRETVKLQVDADLKLGSFTLKRGTHSDPREVLSLYFDSFKARVLQRPDSFLADVSLGGMRLNDGTTRNSFFPQIVRIKESPRSSQVKLISDGSQDELSDAVEPLFQFQFEQNPLDESADLAVRAKLKSMEIIYNPNFVVEIVRFFKPPERHMDSIYALMDTAGATVESIRQQTRAGLEFALEEHKTINAQLDLQAPLIIIPEDVEVEKSTCLIIDAGHVSLNSELVDQNTIKEIHAKHSQNYTDEDLRRLESLMYDKFLLDLEATQVLIGPSVDETRAKLYDQVDKSLHIVDRINIRFVVQLSIVPKTPNIPKIRVSGHLPVLHASVSDVKYKSLMKIINVAIPKLDEDDENVADEPWQLQGDAAMDVEHSPRPRTGSSVSQRRKSMRQSAPIFPFIIQDAAVIDDDDDDALFQDALQSKPADKTDIDLKLAQHVFELSFRVDRLQGSLYRCDPEGIKPDQLLVELLADGFKLDVTVRPFDLSAEVALQSLALDDHVEENPLPEFKRLVSSGDAADGETDEKALVQVKYSQIKRESPEFTTLYHGVEKNLDVAISTINLIVTRKTLLTLLDFILVTFTNPDGDNNTPHITPEESEDDEQPVIPVIETPSEPEKINIHVRLNKVALVLNNDGIRLATLSVMAGEVEVFVQGNKLRVSGKLGNLTLLDDVDQGAPLAMRELVTIQGEELADFKYETFDPANKDNYPGYDQSIGLQTGSIKVNFVSEPFRKIINFLVKFGKMQAIFNAARQAAANQANQIQQSANKFHFDIMVRTPIIVFPRVMEPGTTMRDMVTAYLGEIYAKNQFVPLDDSMYSPVAMKIQAGIRNIRLTSDFHFGDDTSEELELLHQVDLGFNITYAEHMQGVKRPDVEVVGNMTELNLRITQVQMKFLLELARTIPAAFAADPDVAEQEAQDELPAEVSKSRSDIGQSGNSSEEQLINLGPELTIDSENWVKLDLVFRVPKVGLEMIVANEDEPVGDLDAASLSTFSLDDTTVKLSMVSDGSLESELTTQSLTIRDSRSHETNKFRKIMTSLNKDVQQFMASVTISGGKKRHLIAMAAIDSPRIILALDHLFAIQKWVTEGLEVNENDVSDMVQEVMDESADSSDTEEATGSTHVVLSQTSSPQGQRPLMVKRVSSGVKQDENEMTIAFRANVVDAQIILIANPPSTSSEAIVLGTKQILVSQQHALTLQVSEMGMFLCRMDHFEDSRLRILDDFSLFMSMDTSKADVSSIHIDVQPLVLRLSLRDVLLALQIFGKASELSGGDDKNDKTPASEKKASQLSGGSSLKQRSASGRGTSTMAKSMKTRAQSTAGQSKLQLSANANTGKAPIRKREELGATVQGLRVVLLGDLHELPILDLSVKNFTAEARDWSSDLDASTTIDIFVNVYNFSKSAWEPLIEPWQLGFRMSRKQENGSMAIELSSKKMMELTITSATIALASHSAQFLNSEEDVLSKPRGVDTPYRIRNYTGFDINVWADAGDDEDAMAIKLADGQEAPWRFEDWEKMREKLSTDVKSAVVGINLQGSSFQSVNKIPVNREGEFLYNLKPRVDNILHRLLVEVTLGVDNVKCITLRSPLTVENNTQIPVEIGVFDAQEGHLLKIEKIPPGESRPAPVGAAYMKQLLVRPDQGFGYSWSTESLWWRDMLKRPTRTITCRGESDSKTPPFYFQMNAVYDRSNPLCK